MPGGGMFELRRDDVTGWWVAVVVDRAYDRSRFARRAEPVGNPHCANCLEPPGGGVRVRDLKQHAFSIAGPEFEPREAPRDGARDGGREAPRQASLGLVADVGSWATIVAPPEHHGPLSRETPAVLVAMLARARDAIAQARQKGETAYLQVVQNWGRQAGALTNHLCLDMYDLPQIPHRVGEELGGAARYLIREGVCPYCRLVRDEVARGERLVFEDAASVAFAPYASRSPFELWVVPREHEADFARATDGQLTSAAETLQKVLRLLRRARWAAVQPGASHGAPPGSRRRHLPLALGDPSPPARDRRPRARHGPARQPDQPGGGRHRSARRGRPPRGRTCRPARDRLGPGRRLRWPAVRRGPRHIAGLAARHSLTEPAVCRRRAAAGPDPAAHRRGIGNRCRSPRPSRHRGRP